MKRTRPHIPHPAPFLRRLWLAVLFITGCHPLFAQKYNFINFNVENGLVQSQVSCFTQDADHQLIVGTYGGISIFDGTNFFNYNKSSGLPQNYTNSIKYDRSRNIWIGTNNGICRFDGHRFTTFPLEGRTGFSTIEDIQADAYGHIWVLSNNALFRLDGSRFRKEPIADTVTCITLDNSGKLWAYAYRKGIFVRKEDGWRRELDLQKEAGLILLKLHFGSYSGTLYAISNRGIQIVENGGLKTPDWAKHLPAKGTLNTILEDSKGNIWLSLSDGGAWLYNQEEWAHYTYHNGLTDDNINAFFEDAEGNIWIGTNGAGIFRYTGSLFTYYDRSAGLASPSVMSIAQNPGGTLFLASNNSGLYQLENGVPKHIALPAAASRISSIATDTSGLLWIGTDQASLWKLEEGKARIFAPAVKNLIFGISQLYRQGNKLWIAAENGLFCLENNKITRENVERGQVYSCIAIGKDSLLIGSLRGGVYLYRTDIHQLQPKPLVENSTTLCFEADSRHIYIGTDDKGVLIWNRATGAFSNIDHSAGLTCDYVYSLLKDRNGNLWVGTGCGIDKITLTGRSYHIRNFGRSDGLLGVENNANASFEDREGYLWFGTTKGAFRYNPYVTTVQQQAPRVVLQSVRLFSKDLATGKYTDSTTPFYHLEWNPTLPPGQNHLTFTFKGVYLSNPEKIKYRYQLAGIDKNFTETDQNTVVYPNLPPGQYLFKVWASDADGNWYRNAVSYPFTISAPFYTTTSFKLGTAFLILGLFLGGVYYRNRQKEYRRRWQEKLREEEQAIVRQKTAEDFHDEIGNKLTRINLLATIAESKLQKPPEEVKKILHQIQDNVNSLYHGSKDIIWSLQPASDFLDEIIFRVRQNTEELLSGTNIAFRFEDTGEWNRHIKTPIDFSRNIIMIFKEAVNNAVKHSGCTCITLSVTHRPGEVMLTLQDDGKGYDQGKTGGGNGRCNMTNRAERIGAALLQESIPGQGTYIRLSLPM